MDEPKNPKTAEESQWLLSQALYAHWEGHHIEAERLYQQALTASPFLLPGLVWYAILLAEHGRPGEAAAKLEQAIAVDDAQTVIRLDAARQQAPDNDAILSLWGLVQSRRGYQEDAQEVFQQALDLAPDNIGALAWMAEILAAQGNYVGAEDYLNRATALAPEDAAVRNTKEVIERGKSAKRAQELLSQATSESTQNHVSEAERLFHEAQELMPVDFVIQREYARFLIANQRYSEAINVVQRGLSAQENNPEMRQMLDDLRAIIEKPSEPSKLAPSQPEVHPPAPAAVPPQPAIQPPIPVPPKPNQNCLSCGTSVRLGVKYCPHCGQAIRYCSSCGAIVRPQVRFCHACRNLLIAT